MKKKNIKKALCLIMTLVIFTGCQIVENINNTHNAAKIATEHVEIVLRCFEEKNAEDLKPLFCSYIADNHDLDEEIQAAFDAFEGKITDKGYWSGVGEVGAQMEDGKLVKQRIAPYLENILTDAGGKYTIRFNEYLIYSEYPELVGVTRISIIFGDETFTIGEIIPA